MSRLHLFAIVTVSSSVFFIVGIIVGSCVTKEERIPTEAHRTVVDFGPEERLSSGRRWQANDSPSTVLPSRPRASEPPPAIRGRQELGKEQQHPHPHPHPTDPPPQKRTPPKRERRKVEKLPSYVDLNRAYKDGYFDDYFAGDPVTREIAQERIKSTVYNASFRGAKGRFRLEHIAYRRGRIHFEPVVDDRPYRIALSGQSLEADRAMAQEQVKSLKSGLTSVQITFKVTSITKTGTRGTQAYTIHAKQTELETTGRPGPMPMPTAPQPWRAFEPGSGRS